jgi:hypothetical protein
MVATRSTTLICNWLNALMMILDTATATSNQQINDVLVSNCTAMAALFIGCLTAAVGASSASILHNRLHVLHGKSNTTLISLFVLAPQP